MKKNLKTCTTAFALVFALQTSAQETSTMTADEKADKIKEVQNYLNTAPIVFIENKGQYVDDKGKQLDNIFYKGSSIGFNVFIGSNGLTYLSMASKEENSTENSTVGGSTNEKININKIEMNLVGANINKENIEVGEPTPDVYNFYYEHCPNGILNVHAFKTIKIKSVYPEIDWVIYSNESFGIKYDFIVNKGGNPSDIKIEYKGADEIKIEDNGGKIILKNPLGEIYEGSLLSYEQKSGKKINTKYLLNNNTISFSIGEYNKNERLIIDPPIIWGTYSGNAGRQGIQDIVTDNLNHLFAVGYTDGNFFVPSGPVGNYSIPYVALYDGCIFRFSQFGVREWSTFYGGASYDILWGIDFYLEPSTGIPQIFITGNTYSTAFPVTQIMNPYLGPMAYAGVNWHGAGTAPWGGDAVYLRFNATNCARMYARMFGEVNQDGGRSIKVEPVPNGSSPPVAFVVCIVGSTNSPNFPVVNVASTLAGMQDQFLTVFDNTNGFVYSRFLGSTSDDFGWNVATTKEAGSQRIDIFVCGETTGNNFTLGVNAGFQPAWGGGTLGINYDGTIAEITLNPANFSLSTLDWTSYYGGNGNDWARAILYHTFGPTAEQRLYIAGETACGLQANIWKCGAFVTNPLQPNGITDMFLLRIDPQPTTPTRVWGAIFGSTNNDVAFDLALDRNPQSVLGEFYLVGQTFGNNFNPIVNDQPAGCTFFQANNASPGNRDGIIMKIQPDPTGCCNALWSSYYGGANPWPSPAAHDWLYCVTTDAIGCIYACGELWSLAGNLGVFPANELQNPTPGINSVLPSFFQGACGCLEDQAFAKFCNCPTIPSATYQSDGCCSFDLGINYGPCFTYLWTPGSFTTAQISISPTVNTTYTLVVTNNNVTPACSTTATYQITMTVNNICCRMMNPDLLTTSNTTTTMDVFPNPNNGNFTVQFPNDFAENITLVVSDVLGRVAYEQKDFVPTQTINLDLSKFPKGYYLVQMQKKNGETIVRQILIQ